MDSIYNNNSFFLFLKHQVKGVFDNDWQCNHQTSSDVCTVCVSEFIDHSNYKEYINKLYNWFKEVNIQQSTNCDINELDLIKEYFSPNDVINCFISIHNYLTLEQVSYFCSPWLDGIYFVKKTIESQTTIITELIIFETLCLQGHLETLKWLYKYIEPFFIDNQHHQQLLFNKLCKQNPQENKF